MSRLRFGLFVMGPLVLGFCGNLPVALAADEPTDEDLLQGTWVATEILSNGSPASKEFLKDFRFTFSGQQLKMSPHRTPDGKLAEYKFTLDATSKPKGIDVLRADEAQPARGLYRLEGDALTVCLPNETGAGRPGELAAPENSRLSLVTLKRVTPAPAGGIILKLPDDRSWVQFAIVGESEKAGQVSRVLSGTLTIRSVGRETVDGAPCRWIEFDSDVEFDNNGQRGASHEIMKFLIPEKRIVGGDNPRDYVLKGRLKNMQGARDLDVKGADAQLVASLDEFLHAPLPEIEKAERVRLETPAGKFFCRYVEARQPATLPGGPATVTKTWATDSIPFGVARYRHTRSRGGSGSRSLELTATKFGGDAKSAIED